MPKFIINSVDDLYECKYITRKSLVNYVDYFGKLKFMGHSYEYFKYNNRLNICGILENGESCNVEITGIPLKLYIHDRQLGDTIISSEDYESVYKIDKFINEYVDDDMMLNAGINIKEVTKDNYFKDYETKIEFVAKNIKEYLIFNTKLNWDFTNELLKKELDIKNKYTSTPKFTKLYGRGLCYYDKFLVYEIEFYTVFDMEKFVKNVEKIYKGKFEILGYKSGMIDKYILSTLSKLKIPINFWVYINSSEYKFQEDGRTLFSCHISEVIPITNNSEIPLNTKNMQVYFDYETYHGGGDQSLIIHDKIEFSSASFVYSWTNAPEYGEIFVMNSEHDYLDDDDSYTYICKNEYLSLLCMIRIVYYLKPDYLVAFNGIDFDNIVTMILLRKYGMLVYYINVLNRFTNVDINNYEIINDEEYLKNDKNTDWIINKIKWCYKLDLKEKYIAHIDSIRDYKLINNTGEFVKSEAGQQLKFSIINIPGIIYLDVFLICKKKYIKDDFTNVGMSLDAMLKKNGFPTKVQFSYSLMWKIFEYLKGTLDDPDIKNNIRDYMNKWREYNNYDSIACKLLLDKFKYLDQLTYEAKSTYIDMYKSCYRAISSKIENLIIGDAYNDGYLINENEKLEKYGDVDVEGAAVKLEKIGLMKYPVQPIDVQSLYPSIMMCLNLDETTTQTNEREIDYILKMEGIKEDDILYDLNDNVNHIINNIDNLKERIFSNFDENDKKKLEEHILEKIKSYIKYRDSKYILIRFRFQSDFMKSVSRRILIINEKYRKGIIPKIEAGYFDARVGIKKQLALYNITDTNYKIIDAWQNAIKVMMNSIYGLLNTKSFNLKNEALANIVTLMGRCIILNTKYFCTNILGLVVHYLDTDSNYLSFKPEVFKEQKLAYKSGTITFREYEEYIVKYTYDKMNIYIVIINEFLKYFSQTNYIRMAVEEILYPSYFKGMKNYICKKHEHGKFNSNFDMSPANYAIKGGSQFKRDGIPILRQFINEYIMDIFKNCNQKNNIWAIMEAKIKEYYNRDYTSDELVKFAKLEKFNQNAKNISVHNFVARCKEDKINAYNSGNMELYNIIPDIEHSDKFQVIIVSNILINAQGCKITKYTKMSDNKELLVKAKYFGYRPNVLLYLTKLSEYLGGFLYPNISDPKVLKRQTMDIISSWCGKTTASFAKNSWKENVKYYYYNMEKQYPGIYILLKYILDSKEFITTRSVCLDKITMKYIKERKIKSIIRKSNIMPLNLKIDNKYLRDKSLDISNEVNDIILNNRPIFENYNLMLDKIFNLFNLGKLEYGKLYITLNEKEKNILIKLSYLLYEYINTQIICGFYSDKN